jgi:hypothetical protein
MPRLHAKHTRRTLKMRNSERILPYWIAGAIAALGISSVAQASTGGSAGAPASIRIADQTSINLHSSISANLPPFKIVAGLLAYDRLESDFSRGDDPVKTDDSLDDDSVKTDDSLDDDSVETDKAPKDDSLDDDTRDDVLDDDSVKTDDSLKDDSVKPDASLDDDSLETE